MAEYKTDKQVNYGFGLSFEATGKAPIVAKRIWNTLADAQAYVNSTTDTAIAGLQLTVINDTNASKNGVYFVKEAAGENGKTVGVLVKLAQGVDVSSLQTQITTNKTAIDNLNGTTHSTSVSKKITDAINKLDALSNVSDDSYGVNITVNQANGLIQKPSIIVNPVETVSGVTSDGTAANKLITAKAVRLAIDEKVAAAVSGVRKFVGCVSAISGLPENPRVGDVYNVTNEFTLSGQKYPAGTDVAWVGAHTDGSTAHAAHWEPLGGVIDFSSLSSTSSGTGNLVSSVTQTNGKVTVTKGNAAITDVTGLQAALNGKVAKTTKINNIELNGDLTLYGKDIKITEAANLPTVGTAGLAVNDTIDVALSKLQRDTNKANTAIQSASIQKASQTYLAVEKEGTELIFNTKVASVGGNTDGLATASGVKTYVDACVGNALAWTTFE